MRPQVLIIPLVLIASLLAQAPQKSADELITEHRAAARQALASKDYAAYRVHLLTLRPLVHDQADLTYAIAAADALLGHPNLALDELNQFAATGFYRDAARDARFTSLLTLPAFTTVAQRLLSNGQPISHGRVVYILPDPDFIAEDIAYDPNSQTFFISSVHKGKIVSIRRDGTVTDFVSSTGGSSVWSMFALAVDSKRHLLWATTAAVPEGVGFQKADAGKTALLCYDLSTRKLMKRFDLPVDGALHALGDMTLSPGGDVYVSDGYGRVYALPLGASALQPISKPGEFRSPQTPALAPDGNRLFVADYSLGIGVIDLKAKTTSWLPRAEGIALEGSDGLYLNGQYLIAIQNGIAPSRVVQVTLTPSLNRAESFSVLEQATPSLGDPTHGVFVGNSFYFIANSGWDRMSDDGKLTPGGQKDRPVVMEMTIHPEH